MRSILTIFIVQEWTKVEKPDGAPWPVGRDGHAACCLNYGDDQPVILMTGGVDQDDNVLRDAWLLDVHSGKWREVREVWVGMGPTMIKHLTIASILWYSNC